MNEEEDLHKINEVLLKCNIHKEESNLENFEYEDFINYGGISDNEDGDDDNYILPDIQNTDISKLTAHSSSLSLKDEEMKVISSCEDPELKNLLLLNRNKNISLMRMFKKMKDMLIECQENMRTKQEYIGSLKQKKIKSTKCWKLAAPYFKGKDLYPCPANPDILRKSRNNEMFFYDMVPTLKWSANEIEKLVKAVKLNYHVHSQNALFSRIIELKTKKQLNKGIESDEENDDLLEELEQKHDSEVDRKEFTEVPPLDDNESIDWSDISEKHFSKRFSSLECKTFWHVYVHPDINKSLWTDEENDKLKEIVVHYHCQNWEAINKELNTNRTPFLTCLHYFSNICNKLKKNVKFSPEEDKLLMDCIKEYRSGNYISWSKVARHFRDRSRGQLFYRYRYALANGSKLKKGKFTEAEDVLLMILVDKFGRNYAKCSEYFVNRSMVQLKARYSSNLCHPIKKGTFTIEDDQAILDHVNEHGEKKWDIIVKQIDRSRAQIAQRNRVIKDFLKSNPEATVADVPRRKHPRMAPEKDNYQFLRVIADQFCRENIIPTLHDIKKALQQNTMVGIAPNPYGPSDPSCSEDEDEDEVIFCEQENLTSTHNNLFIKESSHVINVDDMLTEFFTNSSFTVSVCQNENELHLATTAHCIENLLETLKVDLEIPENFEQNSQLDNLDVAVLNHLCSDVPSINNSFLLEYSHSKTVTKLIPPNVNTLVGLRSLLTKYVRRTEDSQHIFNPLREDRSRSQVQWCINKHFTTLEAHDQEQVCFEREQFLQRFLSLFKFPAIMTLQKPSRALLSTSNYWKYSSPLDIKRTYSKKTCNQSLINVTNKKQVVDVGTKTVTKEEDVVYIVEPPETNSNALPVKILKGIMVKDIKTLKLNPDGKATALQNVAVQNNHIANGTLRAVTDKRIISQLKLQIQQQINDLSKGKSEKPIFKGVTEPENLMESVSNYENLTHPARTYMNKSYTVVSQQELPRDVPHFETVFVDTKGGFKSEAPSCSSAQNWGTETTTETYIIPSEVEDNTRKVNRVLNSSIQNSKIQAKSVTQIEKPKSTDSGKRKSQRVRNKKNTKTSKRAASAGNAKRVKLREDADNAKRMKLQEVIDAENAKIMKLQEVADAENAKRMKLQDMKIEQDVASNANSVFNVGRGELLLEESDPLGDLTDVKMLDAFLKKEKEDFVEDCDFDMYD